MKKLKFLLISLLLLSGCENPFNNSDSINDLVESSSNEIKEDSSTTNDKTSSSDIENDTSSSSSLELEDSSSSSLTQEESSSSSIEIPSLDVLPISFYTIDGSGIENVYDVGEQMDLSKYTNYIILDSEGRIFYTVANAGCGFGDTNRYYSHPLYQDEVSLSIDKDSRIVTIPSGFKGYSVTFAEYGKFANKMSSGVISTDYFELYAYEEYTYLWNSFDNPYFDLTTGVKINETTIDTTVKVESITSSVSTTQLQVGQTVQINITINPSNATDKTLTYSSSDENILSVSSKGLVTAKSEGSARVTISAANDKSVYVDFTVGNIPLPEIPSRVSSATAGTPDGNDYFYSGNANPTSTTVTDGVVYTKYTYSSINNYSLNVYTVTIDLNKVTIELGTPNNSYAPTSNQVLKSQATAYENSSNRKVYAAVNADFFGAGAAGMPNGFSVKDGVVVSNCSPWFESLVNGMWAFSVSYNNVASIDKSANSASDYYYVDNYFELYDEKATKVATRKIDAINNKYVYDPNYGSARVLNNQVITTSGLSVSNKNVLYVSKTDKYDNGNGNINFPFDAKITKVQSNYSGTITLGDNEAALLVDSSFSTTAKVSQRVRVGVVDSDNDAFDNVKTLVGGRHLLVQNYKEVASVSTETTNGATSRRARTAVGLMGDGKVMLFACNDSDGLTLLQVADFMAYYGCQIAMNLDGGGSTGLYIRQDDSLSLKAGSNSRALVNSLLVVEK